MESGYEDSYVAESALEESDIAYISGFKTEKQELLVYHCISFLAHICYCVASALLKLNKEHKAKIKDNRLKQQ